MKLTKLATAVAATLAFASGTAMANPFYLDVNNFDTTPAVGTNGKTALMDEMQVNWSATSVYTDHDSNGVDLGDTVVDSGVGTVGGYLFEGLNLFGPEDTENYGLTHALRFNYTNLTGSVVAMLSPSAILAHYTSGTIDVWADNDVNGTNDVKLLTLDIFNSDGTIGNFNIYGKVTFAHAGTWFFPPAYDWSGSVVAINARIDTNLDKAGVPALQADGTYMRTSRLNGSVEFVPEPGSIALLGLGLLGLGLSRRSKKSA